MTKTEMSLCTLNFFTVTTLAIFFPVTPLSERKEKWQRYLLVAAKTGNDH